MDVDIEKFEITDWDLENEFNPTRARRLTKNQQIYGVWADDDSDDERPVMGGGGGRQKRDFTAPINFISGGFKKSGGEPSGEKPEDKKAKSDSSSSEEEEVIVQRRHPKKETYRSGFSGTGRSRRIAGLQGNSNHEDGFGSWERHTRGIGQKLLLQMGYKPGKGLGKELQGIAAPIQAKKRVGKGALGLYGPEHIQAPMSTRMDEPEVEKPKTQGLQQWKKKSQNEKKTIYVYKTVDDVKNEGVHRKLRGDFSTLNNVKVIDMTGPEQRILSGYHQIHQQHSRPDDSEAPKTSENFAIPELEHNLDILVEEAEQNIIRNDRELRRENDRIVTLEHEEERLTRLMDQEQEQIDRMANILRLVTSFEERSKVDADDPLTLNELSNIFQRLRDDYYEEYALYELGDLSVALVYPMIQRYLEQWDPLKNPHYGLDVFKVWKDILEGDGRSRIQQVQEDDFDPYHQLVWEVWMPRLRSSLTTWNVRHCDPVVDLLENWLSLLPPWIFDNVMDLLIYPRLQKEVEEWNPVADTVPIHSWLHPWLPLMGSRLEPLYGPIRHKLAAALINWHPSDCSAKLILEPWKTVFSKGTLEAFVVSNIMPKLVLALQNFVINPHQQHLDVWHWVMAWQDMLPQSSIIALLEKSFFPRWLQILCTWLGHNPNYEEVTKWYMGWKSMIPENILNHPTIRDQFSRALDIMNRSIGTPPVPSMYQPGARENLAYLSGIERQEIEKNKREATEAVARAMRSGPTTSSLSLSFKELIQTRAEERGLLFAPLPNRYQEGKQVYRFGRVVMYLDRGVIFVFNEKTWVPTSLQSLLDMAG